MENAYDRGILHIRKNLLQAYGREPTALEIAAEIKAAIPFSKACIKAYYTNIKFNPTPWLNLKN